MPHHSHSGIASGRKNRIDCLANRSDLPLATLGGLSKPVIMRRLKIGNQNITARFHCWCQEKSRLIIRLLLRLTGAFVTLFLHFFARFFKVSRAWKIGPGRLWALFRLILSGLLSAKQCRVSLVGDEFSEGDGHLCDDYFWETNFAISWAVILCKEDCSYRQFISLVDVGWLG